MCQDEKNANLKVHLAVDDAQMTMQITKRLCNILKVNINELINKYPSCKLNVTKYVIEMRKLKRKNSNYVMSIIYCTKPDTIFVININ